MESSSSLLACTLLCLLLALPSQIHGKISQEEIEKIETVNKRGNYYLIVVTGPAELKVVLEEGHGTFKPYEKMPYLDVSSSARRFHIGTMTGKKAIVVMSGDGPVDAARCTQLALNIFNVKGVVYYGRAGSADPSKLKIGDVALSARFADCGVWNWEGFNSKSSGGLATLTFSDFNLVKMKIPNLLERITFQNATIYPKPEESEKKFFYHVDKNLYKVADSIEGNELQKCVLVRSESNVCLSNTPTVKKVDAGCSANIYVTNGAYTNFLHDKLGSSVVDKSTAAIASVCYTENVPFIPMRSITNYGGGSASSSENDISIIQNLWRDHAIQVLRSFFKALDKTESNLQSVTGSEIW